MQRYVSFALRLMLFAFLLAPSEPDQMAIPVTFTERQILATQALIDANESESEGYLRNITLSSISSFVLSTLMCTLAMMRSKTLNLLESDPMLSSLEPGSGGNFESARSIVTYLSKPPPHLTHTYPEILFPYPSKKSPNSPLSNHPSLTCPIHALPAHSALPSSISLPDPSRFSPPGNRKNFQKSPKFSEYFKMSRPLFLFVCIHLCLPPTPPNAMTNICSTTTHQQHCQM